MHRSEHDPDLHAIALEAVAHSLVEQWAQFVADRRERVELRDAVIGFIAFVGLIAALATAPWWLA